jgi:hypothetical protein
MLAVVEQPRRAGDTAAVYCRRCDNPRPLAVVGPGILIFRHKGLEQTIDGLTPQQRVWAKCDRCGCQQQILVPQS